MCVREFNEDNDLISIEMCDRYQESFDKLADISEVINDLSEDIERKTYAINYYKNDVEWMPSIESGFDDVVELNAKFTATMADFLMTKMKLDSIKAVCRD